MLTIFIDFSGQSHTFPGMNKNATGRAWRPGLIVGCSLLAALWVSGLFMGPLVPYWERLDLAAFRAFNGSLEWGGAWTVFWGHMNTRPFDVIWAVIMGLPVLWVMLWDTRWNPAERMARGLVIALSVLVGIFIAKSFGGEIDRLSPSLQLGSFVDVNVLIEGLKAKTGSDDSFPGDHGVAALIYLAGFILFVRRPALTALAVVIALANTLPRLIGGGHWLTDVLVGAVGFMLVMLPWMKGAPVLTWVEFVTRPLEKYIVSPILRRLKLYRP